VQSGTVVLAVITASGLAVAAMQVERVLAVHGMANNNYYPHNLVILHRRPQLMLQKGKYLFLTFA